MSVVVETKTKFSMYRPLTSRLSSSARAGASSRWQVLKGDFDQGSDLTKHNLHVIAAEERDSRRPVDPASI